MNQNEKIAKPLTLLREDFMNGMVDLCNTSGLPLFIIENVLKDLIQDIHLASQKQIEADREKYRLEISKLEKKFLSTDE